jgi:hypothetical protein
MNKGLGLDERAGPDSGLLERLSMFKRFTGEEE